MFYIISFLLSIYAQANSNLPQPDCTHSSTENIFVSLYLNNKNMAEKRGCCSHHGGVCGCSSGHALCCDGSLSPSCGCD